MTTLTRLSAAVAALALALPATHALAQDQAPGGEDFKVWDRNTDANIDTDEWNLGIEEGEVFSRWDTDGDNTLSPEEFEARFGMDFKTAELPVEPADPGETGDVSGADEGVSGVPFSERFADASFTAWDADNDGAISRQEFGTALRSAYDVSGDNRIDVNEWRDFGRESAPGGAFGEPG